MMRPGSFLLAGLLACGDPLRPGAPGAPELTNRIVFESFRNQGSAIYAMRPDGSEVVRLTDEGGYVGAFSVSPDRLKLAYEFQGDIYARDLTGRNRVNLTVNPGLDVRPEWSPDGSRIVFASDREGNNEIYLMDAGGSNLVRLTSDPGNDDSPSWSPDGQKIAFLTDRDGNNEIYVMGADGSNPVNLTNSFMADYSPAWSRDGTRLAFGSTREDVNYLYVMDTDGNNVRRLSTVTSAGSPTWSPDDSRIAFVGEGPASSDVFVVPTAGGPPINVTQDAFLDTGTTWVE